jgi:hypothetical protein
VDAFARQACFAHTPATPLGNWHREDWFLVRGLPDEACVARGNAAAARHYVPPAGALNTGS